MGFTLEYESPVEAHRMFSAAVLDWHNLGPKVAPDIIASGVILQGTGGVGTVRQINFTDAMPFSYLKERLDFVDHGNLEAKWTVIEGGYLSTTLDSLTVHCLIRNKASGGCVYRVVTEAKQKTGVRGHDTDEEAKSKEGIRKVLKATDAYLAANRDAYR